MITTMEYLEKADRVIADLCDGDGSLTEIQAERFIKWLETPPRWKWSIGRWEIAIWTLGRSAIRYTPRKRTLMIGLLFATVRIKEGNSMGDVRMVEKFKLHQRSPGRRWEGKVDEIFAAPEEVAGPGKVRLNHGQELTIDVGSYPVGTVVIVSVPKDAKGYRPRPPIRKGKG